MLKVIHDFHELKDLVLIVPTPFSDNRGNFMEFYNRRALSEKGLNRLFVQDNIVSSKKGVLRGLHFQKYHQQGKLVSVINGKIFDVVVDIREESDTFGKWFGIVLSKANKKQLYVPEGFAHGYLVLEDDTLVYYKCTDYYYPEEQEGIIWDDKDLKINWKDLIYNENNPNISKLVDGTQIVLSNYDKDNKSIIEIFNRRKDDL